MVIVGILAVIVVFTSLCWLMIRSRNMQYWLGSYIKQCAIRNFKAKPSRRKVYFCMADHYEPYWGKVDSKTAYQRVKLWHENYPIVASRHRDSAGNPPKHSFFYPAEEYDEKLMDMIKDLCSRGFGDVEIHLHHDNDNAENLRRELNDFKQLLHERHGLLRKDPETGEIVWGFIHGNWALDNSHPEGRWCGVNNEIKILLETGCRYDMTLPSAPEPMQTSTINTIYFAKGQDGCAKSHDTGRRAKVGERAVRDELLLIQGPLELNWKSRKLGVIPRIEAGEVSADCPPTEHRVELWLKSNIVVEGADEHVFIKVYTHGTQEQTSAMFFNGGLDRLWSALEKKIRDQEGCELYYLSAWEMYQKVQELVR